MNTLRYVDTLIADSLEKITNTSSEKGAASDSLCGGHEEISNTNTEFIC